MDERAREILDRARAAVERTADVTVEHRDHDDDGHLTSWSRGMAPKPAPVTAADVERIVRDALPGVATIIHEVRQQLRAEFQEQIGQLRADVEIQRAHAGGDRGEVIDLPNFSSRRHA